MPSWPNYAPSCWFAGEASDGTIHAPVAADARRSSAAGPSGRSGPTTGDSIPGLISELVYGGYKPLNAAVIAAKTNRTAGEYVNPTPATPVKEIVDAFPAVLDKHLAEWSKNPPA